MSEYRTVTEHAFGGKQMDEEKQGSKNTAEGKTWRHGMAGERYGRGKVTACYV
jgi:hypothetical protein